MNPKELLRMVDALHREKRIDKEVIFSGLEQAFYSAARKKFGEDEDINISIDRVAGGITATLNGEEIDPMVLGRIAAQTFKQVMIQKLRAAEGDVVFEQYEDKVNTIVNGTVQGFDRGTVVVNLGDAEAYLTRGEQIQGENYAPNSRMRFYITRVSREGQRVKIFVSRTHPELIVELFKLEVPEINSGVISIKRVVREGGLRTKICVESTDPKVDCVGACVGMRGSRIKNILSEIGSEKIDIVVWTENIIDFIENAMKPAEVEDILVDLQERKGQVLVKPDLLSQAIGRKGVNVRLASQLTGFYIDVTTGETSQETSDIEAELTEAFDNAAEESESAETSTEDDGSVVEALEALGTEGPAETAHVGADTLPVNEAIEAFGADDTPVSDDAVDDSAALEALGAPESDGEKTD